MHYLEHSLQSQKMCLYNRSRCGDCIIFGSIPVDRISAEDWLIIRVHARVHVVRSNSPTFSSNGVVEILSFGTSLISGLRPEITHFR